MLKETLIRVLIGGCVVSAFALLSDMLTPKRFAGLFSAAPSVAIATLILTASREGKSYAAIEARSMMAGALAFVLYASVVSTVLIKFKPPAFGCPCSCSRCGWSPLLDCGRFAFVKRNEDSF